MDPWIIAWVGYLSGSLPAEQVQANETRFLPDLVDRGFRSRPSESSDDSGLWFLLRRKQSFLSS